MGLFDIIGDIGSGLFGLGSDQWKSGAFGTENGGLTQTLTDPAGSWDYFQNGKTNDVNKQIAEENIGYQRERNEIEDARYQDETSYNRAFQEDERAYQRQFAEDERAYNRALQQQIFDREDTALERQASSLSKMGINPLSQQLNGLGSGAVVSQSAAGSAAEPSMSARGGQALHNDMKYQGAGVLQAITPLMSMFNTIDNINTSGLQRDSLREQNDYQRLLNQEKEIENRFKEIRLQKELDNLEANTENTKANTKGKGIQNKRDERVLDFQERNNLNDMIKDDKAIDSAYVADQIKTYVESEEDKKSKNPLVVTGNTLKESAKTVGNALNNTIGEGARAIYKYFSEPRRYQIKNGKRVRVYSGDDDWF